VTNLTVHHLPPAPGTAPLLEKGVTVEVRVRFDGRWVGGYRVAAVGAEGYMLARVSDGRTLPEPFIGTEVRPAVSA
jgi:hypothetical protein